MQPFQNLNPKVSPKTWFEVLKWRYNAKPNIWPEHIPVQQKDKPPTGVMGADFRISWVGHMTFLVQTQGLNILTDPIWSERASPFAWIGPKRVSPPGIDWEDLPPIDLVLVSHNHYDHMDIPTLRRLWERDAPCIVMPVGNAKYLPDMRVQSLGWQQHFSLRSNISVHCLPAQHWSARTLWDKNCALWGTFVVTTPVGALCFIGDTGYDPQLFKDIGVQGFGIKVALLPIGAFEPRWFMGGMHVNPREAVSIYQDLKAEYAIAGHFQSFKLADDGFEQAASELRAASVVAGLRERQFVIPEIGGVYYYPAEATPGGTTAAE